MIIPHSIQTTLIGQEPGASVLAALKRLLTDDLYLLKVDANERSITFRFGMHLQAELPGYSIDCEYNRDGVDPKRIGNPGLHPDAEDTLGQTVFPDVVAHIRGEKRNYLIIEFKKSSNSMSRDIDFAKLRGYKTDQRLAYQYALFLELKVGESPCVVRAEWVDVENTTGSPTAASVE